MAKHQEVRYLVTGLAIADATCVLAAFLVAGWLAAQPALGAHTTEQHRIFIIVMLPVFLVIFLAQGLYDPKNLLGGTREYAAVLRACTYGLVALILVSFAVRRQVSREWLAFSWAAATLMIGTTRFVIRRVAYRLRRRGLFTTRAIVVGVNADSVAAARQLDAAGSGVRVVGFLDDYAPRGAVLSTGYEILGTPAALFPISARMNAHDAIVVPQALAWETLRSVMADAVSAPNGLRIHLSPGIYDLLTTGVSLSEHNHVPLLTVNKARLSTFESLVKTTIDYAVAAALLLAFTPVVLAVAIRLRAGRGGRVLERHRVVGRYGRSFDLLRFSPFGTAPWEFVRKLPGLLNVLMGQLSLVGPRPRHEAEAGGSSGWASRLTIRPGLTGPWRRADTVDEQAVLDLYYIRSYSVWLDLQVIFQRIVVHLSGLAGRRRGAARLRQNPSSKSAATVPPARAAR